MGKKVVETSGESPVEAQPHGGALRRGNLGNKGGGRQKDKWREDCRQALEDAKGLAVVKGIISGDIYERVGTNEDGTPIYGETKNSDRLGAIKFLAAYAEGQPTQMVEMKDSTPQAIETAEQTAARLLTGMAQVLGVMGLERSQKALMLQKLKGLEVSGEVVEEGNGKHGEGR